MVRNLQPLQISLACHQSFRPRCVESYECSGHNLVISAWIYGYELALAEMLVFDPVVCRKVIQLSTSVKPLIDEKRRRRKKLQAGSTETNPDAPSQEKLWDETVR